MPRRYCTNCGAVLPEGARFCGDCGSPAHGTVRATPNEAGTARPPQGASGSVRGGGASLGKLALLLVGIVVALAVLLGFVLPFLVGFFGGLFGV